MNSTVNNSSSLSQTERSKLAEEVELLSNTSVNFGLRCGDNKALNISDAIFEELVKNVLEKCPFFFMILL
jgi:hypothetical protein